MHFSTPGLKCLMVNKTNIHLKNEQTLGYPPEILTPNENKLNMEKSGMLEGKHSLFKYYKNIDNFLFCKTEIFFHVTVISYKTRNFSRLSDF